MLIYILRHGDSSSDSKFDDHERPLTERGEKQALIVGNYLKKINAEIELILSSPLLRAKQTASIVNSVIAPKKIIESEYLQNGTDQTELIQQLNKLNSSSVLLVGHIPHLSNLISLLLTSNYNKEYELKKCSLTIVDIPYPITPGTGKLNQIIHVDEMEKT